MLVDWLVPPPSDSHSAPPSYHAKCSTSAPRLESSHGKQLQQQQEDDVAEWSRSSWDMPVKDRWAVKMRWHQHFWDITMTQDDSYQSSIHDGCMGYMTPKSRTWHLWCGTWASSCCSVSCKSWQSLPCSPKAKACIRLKHLMEGGQNHKTENDGSFIDFNEARTFINVSRSVWGIEPSQKMHKNGMNPAKTSD